MTNHDLVKKEIKAFIDKQEMFTSVDISNEIKKQGIWLSNTETSNILKDLFNTDQIFDSYAYKRLILSDGKGTNVNAIVYYPSDQDPLNYKKFTISINPAEFDIIKQNKQVTTNTTVVVNVQSTTSDKTKNVRKPRAKAVKKDPEINTDNPIISQDSVTITDSKFSKSKRDYSKFNFVKIK